FAGDKIVDDDRLILGHFKPKYGWFLLVQPHAIGSGRVAMEAAVHIRGLHLFRGFTLGVEFLFSPIAWIGVSGFEQAHGCFNIERLTLGLEIRGVRTADLGTLVPGDAEPTETFKNWLQGFGPITHHIGVVDAKDKLTTMPAREEPIKERGANA